VESGSSIGSSSGAAKPPSRIHDLKGFQGKVAQIVMHGIDSLLARARVKPGAIGAAAPTHFGHDHQVIGGGCSACLII